MALADEPAGSSPAAEPEKPPEPAPYALSVGTGPRPLNTATLGLTGLGARILLPAEGLYPWLGAAYNAGSVSTGSDVDRYVTRVSTWTLSAGVRGAVGKGPQFVGVDPYLCAGVFVNRAGTHSGYPSDEEWDSTASGVTLGSTVAFGLEGYLTPHLSVGVELGGSGGWFTGAIEDEPENRALVLSTLSAAQITVWR
jgi:hypothetical protein